MVNGDFFQIAANESTPSAYTVPPHWLLTARNNMGCE
jgi:hypothetical protein